ncbi:MAG: hypothetical protein WCB04_13675 [Mycobacteriales bacterium]
MRMHIVTTVCVGVLIVPGVTAAAASAAPAPPTGSIGVRLVDVAAHNRNDPRARIYIVDRAKPGGSLSRRISVQNGSGAPQRVAVYPAGAMVVKGMFSVADGAAQDELSTWTTVDRSAAVLPAGASELIRVTITVPPDASPGERYAVVWAEIRSPAAQDGGITQVNRVGIRIYLSVGTGGEPASDFSITSLEARRLPGGQPEVLALVKNTGGRALDMRGTLRLSAGPGGLSAGPFAAKLGTTLGIGDSAPVTITLDKTVPNGPWDARIELTSGLLTRSARGTITFPTSGDAAPVQVHPASNAAKWWVAGAALLLVALAGPALLARFPGWRRFLPTPTGG